jgi:hypothetical protein
LCVIGLVRSLLRRRTTRVSLLAVAALPLRAAPATGSRRSLPGAARLIAVAGAAALAVVTIAYTLH